MAQAGYLRLRRFALVLVGCLLLPLAGWAGNDVVVCPINGMIDDGVAVLVERTVREAADAKAIVFEIDTPGGLVDSAIRITKTILGAPCPTIAYIQGMGAISAGALISFACTHIIMTPDTNIGAATPVAMTSEGMMPTGEKEVSFMRAKMRALAERNHHSAALGEAMVDKDIELRSRVGADGKPEIFAVYPEGYRAASEVTEAVRKALDELPPELAPVKKLAEGVLPEGGEAAHPKAVEAPPAQLDNSTVILPAGKLLTLTPKEAQEFGLIQTTANTIQEVLGFYGFGGAGLRYIEPTWAESLFRFLTNPMVAGLLLMFGIGGIYIEMKTPGFSLPGLVGIVCLILFFGSHYVIGVAEWLDILLVAAGIILILIEVFIIPGFGAVGGIGLLCLLVGLYMTLTGVAIPRYSWDYDRLRNALVSLTITASSFGVLLYIMWKLFPHTPLYGRLVQVHVQHPEAGYTVQTKEDSAAVGLRGVALSMLRPAGKARFGDKTFQVVTRGEFIPPGSPIAIILVDGNRYVVESVEENH